MTAIQLAQAGIAAVIKAEGIQSVQTDAFP
jgi:hypothetical protein